MITAISSSRFPCSTTFSGRQLSGLPPVLYVTTGVPQAVASTEMLLRQAGLLDRADLYCAGHQRMDEYVTEPVSAVVFNLGWLPGGDHSVTTFWETTREAVSKALHLLQPGGVLVLCAYPGHPAGDRERQELPAFLAALSNKTFNVLHQRFLNAGPGAPECFVVQKLR